MNGSRILKGWKAIAAFLGVHEDTARKLSAHHGLPVAKIDGTVFSSRNVIEAWIIGNLADGGNYPENIGRMGGF